MYYNYELDSLNINTYEIKDNHMNLKMEVRGNQMNLEIINGEKF